VTGGGHRGLGAFRQSGKIGKPLGPVDKVLVFPLNRSTKATPIKGLLSKFAPNLRGGKLLKQIFSGDRG
ncbi:hypothetical protein, partial [Synechocystis sp. LEGE 06083]|uniref:hypothetical protein n=1 Tax=Synechocystis sp. LEGE 06083 TaxID=915336 RepID=UPI001D14516B